MEKTCKDCVHVEICKLFMVETPDVHETCDYFKDRARFVELPFKIGDVVYFTSCEKVYKDVVDKIEIHKNCILIHTNDGWSVNAGNCYGLRKEAKQTIKEREKNEGK